MCFSTGEAFLGPADAVLDLTARRLLFATGLTGAERVILARRVFAAAGQEQPADTTDSVVCICGFELDVSPDMRRRPRKESRSRQANRARPRSQRSTSLRR